jgi:hypothetical protein
MNMVKNWSDTDREKPVPVPLCPPQLHWTDLGENMGHCGEKSVTNHMGYGTFNENV